MDDTTKAIFGTTGGGGFVGGCCGPVAFCGFCGIKVAVISGAGIGAFVLCVACYTGSKFNDLHLVGKGAVAVSSTAVGAFGGVSVVESAALGAGLVVGGPALIAGAAVGIALVGSAVVIGAIAAASDKEKAKLKKRQEKLEEEQEEQKKENAKLKTRLQILENLVLNNKSGS